VKVIDGVGNAAQRDFALDMCPSAGAIPTLGIGGLLALAIILGAAGLLVARKL
jgi:hypothetical protein